VVLVADDPGMYSSQNEQDSRYFAKMGKVPVLEPSDASEARSMIRAAYELSERFATPVMFRTTTRLAHTRGIVESGDREEVPRKEFVPNVSQYAIPVYAQFRRPELEAKLRRLGEFAEEFEGNFVEEGDPDIGIISHGIPYQYVKEVAPEATVFKLGMLYPLPEQRLKEFCSRFEKVFVVEESEGFIQQEMAGFGILNVVGKERFTNIGELSADLVAAGLKDRPVPPDFAQEVAVLPRPPKMCAGCPHSGVFAALRKLRVLVTGDIGCYTLGCLPPLSAIDTTFCMGASIGNATGFAKAGEERVVAVIGDSTFLHSGLPSLMSAVYNQVPTTLILLDNSTTGMTGHQEHPGTGHTLQDTSAPAVDYEALIRAIGVQHVTVLDPWELKDLRAAVKGALAHPGPAVVITRRACVLLPEEKAKERTPYWVDEEACIQCDYCMESGCPALVMEGEYPVVRDWECIGCAICAQLCPVDAILPVQADAVVRAEEA
jgi:indolepyruvate ferredoxin oxidoreductase alpha subunit